MRYDPEKHHRCSIRLKGYDYSQAGAYFVTICTKDRACLFGEVVDGEMRLNDVGRIVVAEWERLPERFPHVVLDGFIVMPNHVHGIVVITPVLTVEAKSFRLMVGAGLPRPYRLQGRRPTLGNVVAYFKYQTTKAINAMRRRPGVRLWQRNYYERIIRNEDSLNRMRKYIAENPARWAYDQENPSAIAPEPEDT